VVERLLERGVLEAGFARVRRDACQAEYLSAFGCKARYFRPSCHAKRLAEWSLWLGDELLAHVPHLQMVLTVPKRLRPCFLWRRKLLGAKARVAARTATAFVRATLDEPELSVGIVLSIRTNNSLLNWQPHIHALVTDSGLPAGWDLRAEAGALAGGADGGVPARGAQRVRGAGAGRAVGGNGDVGVDALGLQRP